MYFSWKKIFLIQQRLTVVTILRFPKFTPSPVWTNPAKIRPFKTLHFRSVPYIIIQCIMESECVTKLTVYVQPSFDSARVYQLVGGPRPPASERLGSAEAGRCVVVHVSRLFVVVVVTGSGGKTIIGTRMTQRLACQK